MMDERTSRPRERNIVMNAIISRLEEPSSYAGLAAGAILLGLSQVEMPAWTHAAAGFFAVLAVVIGEGARK